MKKQTKNKKETKNKKVSKKQDLIPNEQPSTKEPKILMGSKDKPIEINLNELMKTFQTFAPMIKGMINNAEGVPKNIFEGSNISSPGLVMKRELVQRRGLNYRPEEDECEHNWHFVRYNFEIKSRVKCRNGIGMPILTEGIRRENSAEFVCDKCGTTKKVQVKS